MLVAVDAQHADQFKAQSLSFVEIEISSNRLHHEGPAGSKFLDGEPVNASAHVCIHPSMQTNNSFRAIRFFDGGLESNQAPHTRMAGHPGGCQHTFP
jgi:hypothetical protein